MFDETGHRIIDASMETLPIICTRCGLSVQAHRDGHREACQSFTAAWPLLSQSEPGAPEILRPLVLRAHLAKAAGVLLRRRDALPWWRWHRRAVLEAEARGLLAVCQVIKEACQPERE